MSTLLSLWQCISVAQVIIKGSLKNIPLKQALLIIFTARPPLQGTIFYVQQWLIGQWHKQHGLHGPSTPHQSLSLFHGQHPQPSVTECIWPIYQPAHKWLSGPASLKLPEPLRTNAPGTQLTVLLFLPTCQSLPNLGNLYCLSQLLPQIFLLLHFRSWNTFHFFKLLCMFMSCLFLP